MFDLKLLKARLLVLLYRNRINIIVGLAALLGIYSAVLSEHNLKLQLFYSRLYYDLLMLTYFIMLMLMIVLGESQTGKLLRKGLGLVRMEDLSLLIFDYENDKNIIRSLLLSQIIEILILSIIPIGVILLLASYSGNYPACMLSIVALLFSQIVISIRKIMYERLFVSLSIILLLVVIVSTLADLLQPYAKISILRILASIAVPFYHTLIGMCVACVLLIFSIYAMYRVFVSVVQENVVDIVESILLPGKEAHLREHVRGIKKVEKELELSQPSVSELVTTVFNRVAGLSRALLIALVFACILAGLSILDLYHVLPLAILGSIFYMLMFAYVSALDIDMKRLAVHIAYVVTMLASHPVSTRDIINRTLLMLLKNGLVTTAILLGPSLLLYYALHLYQWLVFAVCPLIAVMCDVPLLPIYVVLVLKGATSGQSPPAPDAEQLDGEVIYNILRGYTTFRILLVIFIIVLYSTSIGIVYSIMMLLRGYSIAVFALCASLVMYVLALLASYRYAKSRLPWG